MTRFNSLSAAARGTPNDPPAKLVNRKILQFPEGVLLEQCGSVDRKLEERLRSGAAAAACSGGLPLPGM